MLFLIETNELLARSDTGVRLMREPVHNAEILPKADISLLIFLVLERSYVSFSNNSSPTLS